MTFTEFLWFVLTSSGYVASVAVALAVIAVVGAIISVSLRNRPSALAKEQSRMNIRYAADLEAHRAAVAKRGSLDITDWPRSLNGRSKALAWLDLEDIRYHVEGVFDPERGRYADIVTIQDETHAALFRLRWG
ncbi:hypothetical protein [Sphingobium yanoikuyae]|jgi:hypothetical protein|uniref:hypothetical protein n=1 Tax=Sphingobium yanoikuyae TaxID=13690 RepID=UPI0035C792EF